MPKTSSSRLPAGTPIQLHADALISAHNLEKAAKFQEIFKKLSAKDQGLPQPHPGGSPRPSGGRSEKKRFPREKETLLQNRQQNHRVTAATAWPPRRQKPTRLTPFLRPSSHPEYECGCPAKYA